MRLTVFLLFASLFQNTLVKSQVRTTTNSFWVAKEFSKDVALFNSKTFLFENILGIGSDPLQFEIIPLAASSSGELTTLLYRCSSKGQEGIVLGFYGNYWNEAGIAYQGYSYRNLEKDSAIQFLNKIEEALDKYKKFLNEEPDNNNICFSYSDLNILISSNGKGYNIRLFWKGFDSSWDKTAFDRSKKRFERKIK